MRVYVGLILLAAYFCYSCLSQVEYNVFTDKLDWLAACIALRVVGAMLVTLHYNQFIHENTFPYNEH
jgi:hypothetical protein